MNEYYKSNLHYAIIWLIKELFNVVFLFNWIFSKARTVCLNDQKNFFFFLLNVEAEIIYFHGLICKNEKQKCKTKHTDIVDKFAW